VPSNTVQLPENPAPYESELPDSSTPVASLKVCALRKDPEPLALSDGRNVAHVVFRVRYALSTDCCCCAMTGLRMSARSRASSSEMLCCAPTASGKAKALHTKAQANGSEYALTTFFMSGWIPVVLVLSNGVGSTVALIEQPLVLRSLVGRQHTLDGLTRGVNDLRKVFLVLGAGLFVLFH
jgi:hypothetical protein